MSFLNNIGSLLARQWIAGTTEEDALAAASRTNADGEGAILNYLGEDYRDIGHVSRSVAIYLNLLREMKRRRIKGSISVKPSQLGILIGDSLFYRNLDSVCKAADSLGFAVWVDAEEYEYVERTQAVFAKVLKRRRGIGICIQAKLRRSMKDAEKIARLGGMVRLVKGAYSEPEHRAFVDNGEVRRNYIAIMRMLFKRKARLMVATHDDAIIDDALSLERRYGRKVIFAMLKGIRGRLARQLVEQGEDMQIYVPFGEEWLAYSLRRLDEAEHALLVFRSVFQQ